MYSYFPCSKDSLGETVRLSVSDAEKKVFTTLTPETSDVQHVRRGGGQPETELARVRHHKDSQRVAGQ